MIELSERVSFLCISCFLAVVCGGDAGLNSYIQ